MARAFGCKCGHGNGRHAADPMSGSFNLRQSQAGRLEEWEVSEVAAEPGERFHAPARMTLPRRGRREDEMDESGDLFQNWLRP